MRVDAKKVVRIALGVVTVVCGLTLTGCRQDMHNQPKFMPLRGTDFYPDGRSARPQVENTVARGQLHEDSYFYTGLLNGKEGDGMPMPVTMEVMKRGQESYNIYCTPCHSRVGNGVGMVVQRGYPKAATLYIPRLRSAPLGHFFNVITNGYGAMPDYAAQLQPQDRWAVVAYIRALQLSQNAKPSDVAPGAHVEPLKDIARREGVPANVANDWNIPPMAESVRNALRRSIPAAARPDGKFNDQPAELRRSRNRTPGSATAAQK